MGRYFGTDGFRGEANIDLDASHAYLIGSFFGQLAAENAAPGQRAKIVIGKDTRKSGDMFINALTAGVTSAGADSYILGTAPTPCVAYVTKNFDYSFGIMVSASHNPFYDNGIKVLNRDGEKLAESVIERCEDYIDAGSKNAVRAKREDIGISTGCHVERDEYVEHLKRCIGHSFEGLKIALDCANGSASAIAGEVMKDSGADVHVIHNEPNGININVECGSTDLRSLQKYVVEGNFDMGFAFDGDADRCLAVDSRGNEVTGDQIMLLCARRLLSEGKLNNQTLVTTIMSNFGLYKVLDKEGISYEKTAVGDKYVYENMAAYGHSLGGEQSGHIIFMDLATTGDGILTCLMVVDSLLQLNETIDDTVDMMRVYPQVLKNITVDSKDSTMEDPSVRKAIKDAEKMLENDGRVLVRPSGTEPYIRVMAEAGTQEVCEKAVDFIVEVMDKNGHVIS